MQRYSTRPNYARLIPSGNGLAFESSFDADLIRDFKSRIPPEGRKWDAARKRWIVAAQYGALVASLCEGYLHVAVPVPQLAAVASETRLLKLEYLGRTKDRGNGESSATGWADGSWSIIFPETVLREWFEAIPQAPGEKPTLFAVLMAKSDCTSEELRTAYRRMVKVWHPDVNRSDPDAAEQFKVVQHAWEVLSDPLKRKKYEAGLVLAASAREQQRMSGPFRLSGESKYDMDGNLTYRSPLRCGWVLVEGQPGPWFVVTAILQWEDVVNNQGEVMISSWPAGADTFEVNWR